VKSAAVEIIQPKIKIADLFHSFFEDLKRIGSMGYEYNEEGKLVQRTFPDGVLENFKYDDKGRVVGIEEKDKTAKLSGLAKLEYPELSRSLNFV